VTITDETAGAARRREDGTPAETFERTGTDPLDLPVRARRPMFAPRHVPPLDAERLAVVRDRLRDLPAAPAEPRWPSIGAMLEAQAAHGRPPLPVRVPGAAWDAITAAHPLPAEPRAGRHAAPVPEPAPGAAWLRDFLAAAMEDAADGASRQVFERCRCLAPHEGWCPDQLAALARAAAYARLAVLLKTAPGDRAAITALLAEEWREDDAAADRNGGAR
jgi:hypothetical protein